MDKTRNNLKSPTLPYRRLIVKLGTSLLTGGRDHVDQDMMSNLVAQMARLQEQGVEQVKFQAAELQRRGMDQRLTLLDVQTQAARAVQR